MCIYFYGFVIMISIKTPQEIQIQLAKEHKAKRMWMKHSRAHAAKLTGVPEPTIRKFEDTSEISLRQFLMLCGIYSDLDKFEDCFSKPKARTMQELLKMEKMSGKT